MSLSPMSRRLAAVTVVTLIPTLAQAAPLTLMGVIGHAPPVTKLLMILLLGAAVAAVAVAAAKLGRPSHLAGGSAYLSALRLGGPLVGLLGGAYALMNIFIGVSNTPGPHSLELLAPGIAEALLVLGMGLVAGAVAVAANWAIEARLDRAVLAS